ncbi:MAG: rhodanese-like domain-containing protein [Alphaproteobacteria bacterium]|nr:rhodanese-like domain-containing protein [Alphaproteobacteria bacterium]|tara:strand:+ start:2770 stop:3288 length:519 start_codon:yes stop_codon:yes gene_type:complete
MGVKRNAILGILTLATFIGCGLLAQAQEDQVDYDGFAALTDKVSAYRATRLIDLETFNQMKAEDGTLILDTRSQAAYLMGHIDGAVHLNFSDFTDAKLAETIPSKATRILIYCNNNFVDDVAPVPVKRMELALNVPTFINLYGYGYQNIYELDGSYEMADPDIHWISEAASL